MSSLDAIVLAGGHAQRLWPLTKDYPKALLKVAGRPVLYYLLENLAKVPSIGQIVVAIDACRSNVFEEAINQINIEGNTRPILSHHKEHRNGALKGPLEKLQELNNERKEFNLKGSEWLVVGADNVFGFELGRFISFARTKKSPCIAIQRVKTPIQSSEFGVPTVDRTGRVVAFAEKAVEQSFVDISTVCYLLPNEAVSSIGEYFKGGTQDSLGHFIGWLAGRMRVDGYRFTEEWYDIGTRRGILAANSYLLSKGLVQEPALVMGETRITPPVWVHETSVLVDSVIGPNVYVGSGAQIIRSSIENSIVYDACTIRSSAIRDSVIGSISIVEGNVTEAVFGPRSMTLTG